MNSQSRRALWFVGPAAAGAIAVAAINARLYGSPLVHCLMKVAEMSSMGAGTLFMLG